MAKKKEKVSVKDVLKRIPEKELRTFVGKQLSNQEVLDDFMTEFKTYFMQGDSAEAYVSQLINAFLDAEDSDEDWMNLSRQSHLASTVREIAEAATELRDAGNYEGAIDIFFTILEYGIDCVNHNDDSMGYLGGIMDKGIQGLHALADTKVCTLDEDSRESFMDRCWSHIAENTFDGWDWLEEMYEFLITLANCEDEYEDIMENLDEDDYFKSEWNQKRQLELKGELLLKWKGKEAVHQMKMQNLQIQEYREKAIMEAMESSDYQRAYRLALDGIAQDEKEQPGIVPTWNHWMVRIAQKDGNHEFIVKYASLLYLDPFNQHDDFYAILKKEVPADEWDDFALKLAQQALETKHEREYADLCSREKWTDKLMEYVRKSKSIHDLAHYETQLLKDYREEIISMYINHANWLMTNSYNRDRNTYQEMCRHLDHAVQLGGHDPVRDTIEMLRNNYKRCRALMEELNRIQL